MDTTRDRPGRRPGSTAAILGLLVVLAAAPGTLTFAATEHTVRLATDELELNNLIGEITVTGHSGSGFEIVVRTDGTDAPADGLPVETDESGGKAVLTVRFPSESKFVYPRMDKGSSTNLSNRPKGDQGWLSEVVGSLFDRGIKVSGSGSGTQVWADIEVRVPRGATLQVHHGVGRVEASDVSGDVEVELRSGPIEARTITGNLSVESGSGHVTVAGVQGDLAIGTGSGGVDVSDVRGGSTKIATGSGGVDVESVDSERLTIATGSGSVEAQEIGADSAQVATGSGSVTLRMARMGTGKFEIATGSGRVVLGVPPGASIDVHAETGSGGIDVDLPGPIEMRRKEKDEVEFAMGGGDTRVRIGTGSGGVRIVQGG